jgi:peptidyl-prolyl cis-trans isomerase B (cyclophilin B)
MPPAPRSGSKVKAAVFSGVGVLVVVAVIVGLLIANKSSHGSTPIALVTTNSASGAAAGTAETPPTAATTTSPLPSCDPAASTSDETVGYRPCGTAARDVGVPTYDTVAAHRTYTVTIKTNHGDIVFTANGSAAPYTVYSFVYLVQKQYFDNTPCHRLVTAGIFVLQCGDPSGTGSGGPGYAFQDENLASLGTVGSGGTVTYKAGTVAMANAGPDTNGSQFFLVYKDSPISRAYTPFGTITQGLGVIQQIAAAGSDNTNGSGDGAPLDSVKIESVTVQ